MKLLLASLVVLAACTKAQVRPAAVPATQPRVAVLDVQKAVTSTREGKLAEAALHRQFDPDIKKFEQERLAIEDLKRQYQSIDHAPGKDFVKEIDTRQKHYNRETEDARERYEYEQKRVLKDLTAKLMAVAGEYAKQNGFDVILDPNNILWRREQVEITDKVIELYDLKYR